LDNVAFSLAGEPAAVFVAQRGWNPAIDGAAAGKVDLAAAAGERAYCITALAEVSYQSDGRPTRRANRAVMWI
jgi:ABC-type nitrate/sulfonate/bicarbonate transport system substrate-binding protein